MLNKVQKHKEICDKLNEIYQKKNHDYGDAYSLLRKEHPDSILIRIFDKYQRLKTLLLSNDEAEVKDESIKDTLLDLANYCIMELIELEIDKNYSPGTMMLEKKQIGEWGKKIG